MAMTFSLCLLLVAGLLLLVAAWSDLKRRIIPNEVSLAVALIGLVIRVADGTWLAGGALALAIFFAMVMFWRAGLVGGGDVKMLAGCALLVPPAKVAVLLMAVSFSGGVLALTYLLLGAWVNWRMRDRRRVPRPGQGRRPASVPARLMRIEAWRARHHAGLPYGCAIALGTLLAVAGR
jgi:prepilin peptidase CpaA